MYTRIMKSTPGTKKNAAKSKQAHVSNYRFWLVLSCAGLVGLWYVLMVFTFLLMVEAMNSNFGQASPGLYGFLLNTSSILAIFVASFASLPFAVAVFKRLKIEMPLVSAIAFFMAPTFGFTLFAFLSSALFYEPATIYLVLAVSMLLAGLLYGLVIRQLKHKLSKAKFLSIAIGLTLIPILFWMLHRLWVTTQI